MVLVSVRTDYKGCDDPNKVLVSVTLTKLSSLSSLVLAMIVIISSLIWLQALKVSTQKL